jgi:toxin-antitoxin system PIN domain toxin
VILVDANLLVYAHASSAPEHAHARAWLDAQFNGTTRIGLPWPSLLAFLRLVTNPRAVRKPHALPKAWERVDEWLSHDLVWIPQPGDDHARILGTLVRLPGLGGNMVHDMHLAALAMEHGLTLCSHDAGFARFPNLNWIDPLRP